MMIGLIAAGVLYVLFLWWFSTGAILWLDRRPVTTYGWSLIAATVIAGMAVYGLATSLKYASALGAVTAFTCALGIWGWHELTFLTGLICGPRRIACPPDASGWRRFTLATSTLIYHEVALAITALAIVVACWQAPNQIASWTFMILFFSRLSAKLNLFFGVPNFTDEFFPDHLGYLSSYLRKSPASALFPLSIMTGVALAVTLVKLALNPGSSTFEVTGFSLLSALAILATIEHAFMVLPLADVALWRWALPHSSREGREL
jgi:putative photosynthetic complex assembly protein 2